MSLQIAFASEFCFKVALKLSAVLVIHAIISLDKNYDGHLRV